MTLNIVPKAACDPEIIPKADKGFDIPKFAIIYQTLDKDKYAF
jgi:hypothetical protein